MPGLVLGTELGTELQAEGQTWATGQGLLGQHKRLMKGKPREAAGKRALYTGAGKRRHETRCLHFQRWCNLGPASPSEPHLPH